MKGIIHKIIETKKIGLIADETGVENRLFHFNQVQKGKPSVNQIVDFKESSNAKGPSAERLVVLPTMQGEVKNLLSDKGYGFITGQDGKDRFFHFSQLKGIHTPNSITKGEVVVFTPIVTNDNKLAAENVFIIRTNPPGHSMVRMPTIRIENFGPVKYFESEVKDLMFFIGPQASGKSTISKAIFFFKSLKEELLKWISDATPEDLERPIAGFVKYLRKQFLDCFGTTKHLQPFVMEYSYANDKTITLNLKEGYVQLTFSPLIMDELNAIFKTVRNYSIQSQQQASSPNTLKGLLEQDAERRNYFKLLEKHLCTLFAETRIPIFIPAGRNLLSTLAEQIQNIDPHSLDGFTKSFVDRINKLRPVFKDNLRALVEDKRQLTTTKIDFEQIDFAIKVITNILKGEYRWDATGEKVYFNDQEYTKLQFSSSGQQEAVWILLLTFKLVLDQEEVFVVFEEPEAHLYPEAQNDIVELIGLLANARPTNQIVITTHSPYILTAFNNLLYAHQLGQTKSAEVANVFNPQVWIAPNRVAAYFVANGQCQSILDEDLNQIQAEKIDGASSLTNEKYDKLFELDD